MNIEALIKDHEKKSKLLKKALRKLKHKAKTTISIQELEQFYRKAKAPIDIDPFYEGSSDADYYKREGKIQAIEEIISYMNHRFENKQSDRNWRERMKAKRRANKKHE